MGLRFRQKGRQSSSGTDSCPSYKSRLKKAARLRIFYAVIMFLYLFFATLAFLMGHAIIGGICVIVTLYFGFLFYTTQDYFYSLSDLEESKRSKSDSED